MRVKVNNTWYDSSTSPIMVELSEKDRENIANMPPESSKYAMYDQDRMSKEDMLAWMLDQKEVKYKNSNIN